MRIREKIVGCNVPKFKADLPLISCSNNFNAKPFGIWIETAPIFIAILCYNPEFPSSYSVIFPPSSEPLKFHSNSLFKHDVPSSTCSHQNQHFHPRIICITISIACHEGNFHPFFPKFNGPNSLLRIFPLPPPARERNISAAACFSLMFYLFCFNVMRLRTNFIFHFPPSLEATAAEENVQTPEKYRAGACLCILKIFPSNEFSPPIFH